MTGCGPLWAGTSASEDTASVWQTMVEHWPRSCQKKTTLFYVNLHMHEWLSIVDPRGMACTSSILYFVHHIKAMNTKCSIYLFSCIWYAFKRYIRHHHVIVKYDSTHTTSDIEYESSDKILHYFTTSMNGFGTFVLKIKNLIREGPIFFFLWRHSESFRKNNSKLLQVVVLKREKSAHSLHVIITGI
jgi:hypothetical protein